MSSCERARVAKSADATDLKSVFRQRECGFNSRPGHQFGSANRLAYMPLRMLGDVG